MTKDLIEYVIRNGYDADTGARKLKDFFYDNVFSGFEDMRKSGELDEKIPTNTKSLVVACLDKEKVAYFLKHLS